MRKEKTKKVAQKKYDTKKYCSPNEIFKCLQITIANKTLQKDFWSNQVYSF